MPKSPPSLSCTSVAGSLVTGGVVAGLLSLLFLQESKMASTQASTNNVDLIDDEFRGLRFGFDRGELRTISSFVKTEGQNSGAD